MNFANPDQSSKLAPREKAEALEVYDRAAEEAEINRGPSYNGPIFKNLRQGPVEAPKEPEKSETELATADQGDQGREQKLEKIGELEVSLKNPEESTWKDRDDFLESVEELAKMDSRKSNIVSIKMEMDKEDLLKKQDELRARMAKKIEEDLRQKYFGDPNYEGPMNREQTAELNESLYSLILESEHNLYKDSLEEHKRLEAEGGAMDVMLNNKGIQWYRGLDTRVRILATSALFALGGYAVGAFTVGAAAGWGAGRAIRAGLSVAAGGKAALYGEKKWWSVENIKEEADKKRDAVKNSSVSVKDKSDQLKEIDEWEIKETKKAQRNKSLLAIGTGAGAGLFAGLTEGVVTGGGAGHSAVETPTMHELTPVSVPKPTENLQYGETQGQLRTSTTIPIENTPPPNEIPPDTVASETPAESEISGVTESFISDPSALKHDPTAGDSNWGMLEQTLDTNKRFADLRPGQKSFIVGMFNNKTLEDPSQYGIGSKGEVYIGKEVDYTKLFEDKKWVDDVLKKAEELPEHRIQNIEETEAHIAAYVKAHPHEEITPEKVDEIMATKPEAEVPPEFAEPSTVAERPLSEPIVKPEPQIIPPPATLESEPSLIEHDPVTPATAVPLKPNLERTMVSDTHKAIDLMESHQVVNDTFEKGVDDIFGQRKLFRSVKGTDTPEWRAFNNLNTKKDIIAYGVGETERAQLSPQTLKILDMPQSQAFMERTRYLMNQTSLSPYENEHPGDFMKRMIKFMIEHPEAGGLAKAA